MRVTVVTPPAQPVVSLADMKAHLELQDGDWDELITAQIAAATKVLDGPNGELGLALGEQTLKATCGGFDEALRLLCAPIMSVSSVTYLDRTGTEQTLDPATYVLVNETIVPAVGKCWPSDVLCRTDAVRVTYIAGALPPADIIAAIKLMVGSMYLKRETVWIGQQVGEFRDMLDALLLRHKRYA